MKHTIRKCLQCKGTHENIEGEPFEAKGGRRMFRYVCPTTGRRATTILGATAGSSGEKVRRARKPKAAKPADVVKHEKAAAAHERAAAQHEHHAAQHEHEAAQAAREGKPKRTRTKAAPKAQPKPTKAAKRPTTAPRKRDTKRESAGDPPMADARERRLTLRTMADYDVIPEDGWDVCIGILDALVQHGASSGLGSAEIAQADAIARRMESKQTDKGAVRDEALRDLGRDLGAILVKVMLSQRVDPMVWMLLYPRPLAELWASAMTAQGGDAMRGTYDAAKRGLLPEGVSRNLPDLSSSLGMGEGEASVWQRGATGLGLGITGMRLGGALAGPYGAIIGGIGGAALGVLSPEVAETIDQQLGTDKDPSDKRSTDIMGGPDTPVSSSDVPRVDDIVGDEPVSEQTVIEFATPGINPRIPGPTPAPRRRPSGARTDAY